jgi:hypothetical protein
MHVGGIGTLRKNVLSRRGCGSEHGVYTLSQDVSDSPLSQLFSEHGLVREGRHDWEAGYAQAPGEYYSEGWGALLREEVSSAVVISFFRSLAKHSTTNEIELWESRLFHYDPSKSVRLSRWLEMDHLPPEGVDSADALFKWIRSHPY